MESDGWQRRRIRMAFRLGDPNTRMGLDDAAALLQRRAGSTNCEKTRAFNDAAALLQG